MVAGVNGKTGVNAPRAVVEEQKPEEDYVTVLPQPMVVIRVTAKTRERIRAIMKHVS